MTNFYRKFMDFMSKVVAMLVVTAVACVLMAITFLCIWCSLVIWEAVLHAMQ